MSRRVLASLEAPPSYRRESMENAISDAGWTVVEVGGVIDVWERDGDRLMTRAIDGAVTVFRRCTPAELSRLLTVPEPAPAAAEASASLFDMQPDEEDVDDDEDPPAEEPPARPEPQTRAERDAQREADRKKFPDNAPF